MSKRLIWFLLAATAMAQSAPVAETVVWQRAKTSSAPRPASASKPADPKVAAAESKATDPEVAEAVHWERAKDRAAQREIAKSKKK